MGLLENPAGGFNAVNADTRAQLLWGQGGYFCREAKYCGIHYAEADEQQNGTLAMCLTTTGMCCQGDPRHGWQLPLRQPGHPYNTAVDALTSPELFITHAPGASYPAYIITYGQ